MAEHCMNTEEHELPVIEAILAGTLALMTGYSQALQAELHPRQRLVMGEKIGSHLWLLQGHPHLSPGFSEVLRSLHAHWQAMSDCTRDAALDCTATSERAQPCAADASLHRQCCDAKRLH